MPKIRDLDLLKNMDILYNNKIILYGAGGAGKRAVRMLKESGIQILGFSDSNEARWGEAVEGNRILDLEQLSKIVKAESAIIIISIENLNSVEQVLEVLDTYGMSEAACYTFFALKNTIELHIDDVRINESYRTEMKLRKALDAELVIANKRRNMLSMLIRASLTNTILVFQPGKVGSSTVTKSLAEVNIPCEHIHSLFGRWNNLEVDKNLFLTGIEAISHFHSAKKLKIISLLREPVSRNVSGYFQPFRNYIYMNRVHKEVFIQPDTYEGIRRLLEKEIQKGTYGAMFEWFNMELKEPFGIDVLECDFDKEKGYGIVQNDIIELLLIKLEKLNACEEVIGKFVGVDDFKLINSNVENDKPYKFVYEEVKETIEIPEHILDFYYKDNRAMDHFYSHEEKEQFRKKWSRKSKN